MLNTNCYRRSVLYRLLGGFGSQPQKLTKLSQLLTERKLAYLNWSAAVFRSTVGPGR